MGYNIWMHTYGLYRQQLRAIIRNWNIALISENKHRHLNKVGLNALRFKYNEDK